MRSVYHSKNNQRKQYSGKRHNNEENNFKPRTPRAKPESTLTPKEPKLYLNSVENYFKDLLINNCYAETYDEAIYQLQTIMKMTFEKNSANFNIHAINRLNNNNFEGDYVIILPGKFDASKWLKLYTFCLPDLSFPKYTKEWGKAIIWGYKNVREAIDAIQKSVYIAQTKQINEKTGKPDMDRDEYHVTKNTMNSIYKNILDVIDKIIMKSSIEEIESIKNSLVLPTFIDNDIDVYRFFSIRVAWMMISLRGNYINFGEELNPFTQLINYSKEYPKEEYILAMTTLRERSYLENKYGHKLCSCIARLIEETLKFNYMNDKNIVTYISNFSNITFEYLNSNENKRKTIFSQEPIQKEISVLINSYTETTQDNVILILNTYTQTDLEKYMLPLIINNRNPSYDLFLLLFKYFNKEIIKQNVIGGLFGRPQETQAKQLSYLLQLRLISLQEIFENEYAKGDLFMDIIITLFDSEIISSNKEYLNKIIPSLELTIKEPRSKHYLKKLTSN